MAKGVKFMATWNIVTLATVAKGNKFLVRTLRLAMPNKKFQMIILAKIVNHNFAIIISTNKWETFLLSSI